MWRFLRSCLVAVLLVVMPGASRADYVLLKNGRVVHGRLVSKSSREVVFQIRKGSSDLTVRYPLDDVDRVGVEPQTTASTSSRSPETPARAKPATRPGGPSFLVAPIHGLVGLYATKGLLNTYISIARIERPDLLILDIDSPDGDVQELEGMLDLLQAGKDVPFVAYVRNAHSAGAILATACPRIVMAPGSSIGAAIPYSLGERGVPQNLAEKFQSAIRARWRSAASSADHEPLLVEGMVRADLVLSRIGEGCEAKIVEGGAEGTLIKSAGRILTLTAQEAVNSGLALGISDTVPGCAEVVGVAGCTERSRAGLGAYATHRKATDDAAKRYATAITKARDISRFRSRCRSAR